MAAEAQKLKLKAKYAPGSEKAKASNHVSRLKVYFNYLNGKSFN